MADATDPLSLVYVSLWSMLEAHSGLTDLVRVGNRVKYEKFLHVPIKDVLQDADVPEVGVIPTGSSYGLQVTSNGTRLDESYEAGLLTGEVQLAQVGAFLPVKWELLRAFSGWQSALSALTWNGKAFVKLLKIGTILDIAVSKGQLPERGIVGWLSVIRFDVTMFFRTADLQPS